MVKVVLYHPDIPQNTGNIARTCVATGAQLILIRPLGFSLSDKYIKRSGMDYWPLANVEVEDDLDRFLETQASEDIFFISTKGKTIYSNCTFSKSSCLIFGSESRGLDQKYYDLWEDRLITIPMLPNIRSLNLATSVGVVLYEVVRQTGLVT